MYTRDHATARKITTINMISSILSVTLSVNNEYATDERIHRDIKDHGKLIDGEPKQYPRFAFFPNFLKK